MHNKNPRWITCIVKNRINKWTWECESASALPRSPGCSPCSLRVDHVCSCPERQCETQTVWLTSTHLSLVTISIFNPAELPSCQSQAKLTAPPACWHERFEGELLFWSKEKTKKDVSIAYTSSVSGCTVCVAAGLSLAILNTRGFSNQTVAILRYISCSPVKIKSIQWRRHYF